MHTQAFGGLGATGFSELSVSHRTCEETPIEAAAPVAEDGQPELLLLLEETSGEQVLLPLSQQREWKRRPS